MAALHYDGYNGRLSVEEEVLTLVHWGLVAKGGGLATDRPRRIPLQAVSGVAFRPATRLVNGYITLGLGGATAPELGATEAGSDPNTVTFRHRDSALFHGLYDWLQGVVRYNQEHGIDCAAVAFDAPAATQLRRSEGLAEERQVQDFRSAPPPVGAPIQPSAGPVPTSGENLGRRERAERRSSFEALAMAAAGGDMEALRVLPGALEATRAHWRRGKLESKLWEVFASAIRQVGADDVMTVEEEGHLVALAGALGLSFGELSSKVPTAFEELVVCRINDGRPPTMSNPPIIAKRGEATYGSFAVGLMKEVVRREFRGGSSGVSIPIGFGMRYRTGSARGRSVVVGTDLVAEDTGVLVVTSTRSVFTGAKKTLEFRNDRLVAMQQYTDGLRLNVSNRQTASLFKFGEGSSPTIAAALISHAVASTQ
jgi:Domain of unknown function (DUF4429)